MTLSKKLIVGGAAGLALVLSAGAVFASPADATGNVNVRSGPGVQYPVVSGLTAGESVNVRNCTSGWCYVTDAGRPGWVSAAYLAGDRAPVAYAPDYYPDYYSAPIFDYPPPLEHNYPVWHHHMHLGSGPHHWTGVHVGMNSGPHMHSGSHPRRMDFPDGGGHHHRH